MRIFNYLPIVLLLGLSACSEENPTLGGDLLGDGEKVKLDTLSSSSLPGFNLTPSYEDYNPSTANSSYLLLSDRNSPRIGNLKTEAVLRFIPNANSAFNPDSLVSVLSAKLYLSPSGVNLGDTTQPFSFRVLPLLTKPTFSSLLLKDRAQIVAGTETVADTTYTGTMNDRFFLQIKDTNWVRFLLNSYQNTAETCVLTQYSKGGLLEPTTSGSRAEGVFGFASNLFVFGYLDDPEIQVRTLVKNGSSVDSVFVTFSLNAANQLSQLTEGPAWSDNTAGVLSGLSGKRLKLTFSDNSFIPQNASIFQSQLSLYQTNATDTVNFRSGIQASVTNIDESDNTPSSPASTTSQGSDSRFNFSTMSLMQNWSIRGRQSSIFILISPELTGTDILEFSLDQTNTDRKPLFTLVYSKR